MYFNKKFFFIIIFVFIALLRWQKRIWFYLIVQLMSIYGLFYSIWHVGIENKLLLGPAGCSSGLNLTDNTLSLKEQILSKPVINCEDIAWSMFGLSAATINSLLLLLIFILNAIYLWSIHGEKKEKNYLKTINCKLQI